ncbi:myosin-2 heavy chain, non muscle-like isoform X2 [Stylophora pistillata]|uniref:myosin-2 heavy chain, non muscle-like isoform X2 n=1 Tax=Stylophora pistillata TaxID=50429 RepID=UPI000C03E8A0|nr:myosin-2 heavy chain, non muscle-like isoform X2 [Stylophora pistillata]
MFKRTNSEPSTGSQKAPQTEFMPKGGYKSVLLTPSQSLPLSPSELNTPGFLCSFGFANNRSSSQPETPKSHMETTPQTSTALDDVDTQSKSDSSMSLPSVNSVKADLSSSLPPQKGGANEEKHVDLSESQLNFLSHNLSEIADKVSPSKYDEMNEVDLDSLEILTEETLKQSSQVEFPSNEQTRFKTPYSRRSRENKSYVSKQKSFTRKRTQGYHSSHQEMNNNGEISLDTSNVLILGNAQETFKHDSESESGYSSSMSTSISLSDENEAFKRLSSGNGSGTDFDADELTVTEDADRTRKNSVDKEVRNERPTPPLEHRDSSYLQERLDSLIQGVSTGMGDVSLAEVLLTKSDVNSHGDVSNVLEEPSPSFKLTFTKNQEGDQSKTESKERSNSAAKPPFPLLKGKVSSDDSAIPRSKGGKRPGLVRRRTTLVSFRPPKQMAAQEGEGDIVEMDEVGFMQLFTDIKSLKTQLLKLKRELQEADVVSPLMHSHSCLARRASASVDSDPAMERETASHRKRMLNRTMTMDPAAMQERIQTTRTRGSSMSSMDGKDSVDDVTEISHLPVFSSSVQTKEVAAIPDVKPEAASTGASVEEVKKLRDELGEVKNKLLDLTQERTSLMIEREELEHELDSKNHTIRMLQKQLEAQDNRDEIAYFKSQVKSLTDQIQQQQQKITELRYRSTSPGPVPLGSVPNLQNKKEAIKSDIRNRLRDAFVRHLGESSKSHVQLSKHIQKAEQNIIMAQKDKSRPSFERSDSHSSVERGHEDSDGREYESDSTKSSNRRGMTSSGIEGNNEDSSSEAGRSRRRRTAYPSQDESDGRASDSDSGKSNRRRIASPPLDSISDKPNKTILESNPSLPGIQIEVTDTGKTIRQSSLASPRTRKLSRSKLFSKIESSPLSHSWTPGAIEKIVKSWREAKSPDVQEKTKEEDNPLKHETHVQFL